MTAIEIAIKEVKAAQRSYEDDVEMYEYCIGKRGFAHERTMQHREMMVASDARLAAAKSSATIVVAKETKAARISRVNDIEMYEYSVGKRGFAHERTMQHREMLSDTEARLATAEAAYSALAA